MEDDDLGVKVLKGVRVLSRRGVLGRGDIKLSIGDLVYDEKNKEYGILLSVKPEAESIRSTIRFSIFNKIPLQTFPTTPHTCVILTYSSGDDTVRVRYTNSRQLTRIEGETRPNDIDKHCQKECIMECSKDCSLWKYRTSVKT